MFLRGPERYNPVLEEWLPYYWPDIIDASLDMSGEIIYLRENSICIVPRRRGVYIYHSFSTAGDTSMKPVGSRWMHSHYPVEGFDQLAEHCFTTMLSNFLNFKSGELCTAVLRLQLAPDAAKRLGTLIH